MNGFVANEGTIPDTGSKHLEQEDWVRDTLKVGIMVELTAELPPEVPGSVCIGNFP